MIDKLDAALRFHREALGLRAQRQEVLSANIANADTPGYKARDFDFASQLSQALEGGRGGGVALAVTSLVFPPDPALHVGRAAQAVFSGLGAALERVATALSEGDAGAAGDALASARTLDAHVGEFEEALRIGRETARLSPRRRASLGDLERYGASFAQVDFAVRDTRVLARHAVRLARSGAPIDPALPDAVHELGAAVWSLAGAYDQPDRADAVRGHALRAGALAGEAGGGEVAAQVRSTAVDLRRAADLLAAEPLEAPTEELLAAAA